MNGEERKHWPHVLFGYDGTAENDAALRWAVEEARLRGIGLLMCHCWHWPYPAGHTDPEIETIMKRAGENLLDSGWSTEPAPRGWHSARASSTSCRSTWSRSCSAR
ncbi:universal stress protein, partial [Actinomadura sp. NPDC049382]|uniref:universal stress protein n=1 Tax=Actinomadura sp. NPDC049382 TaxID=3158220 RepID=UPI00341F2693